MQTTVNNNNNNRSPRRSRASTSSTCPTPASTTPRACPSWSWSCSEVRSSPARCAGSAASGRVEVTGYLPPAPALALEKTHRALIVHRDLKPENLFLTERGGRAAPDQGARLRHRQARRRGLHPGPGHPQPGHSALHGPGAVPRRPAPSPAPPTSTQGAAVWPAPRLGMIAYTLLVGASYRAEGRKKNSNVFAFAGAGVDGWTREARDGRARRHGVLFPGSFVDVVRPHDGCLPVRPPPRRSRPALAGRVPGRVAPRCQHHRLLRGFGLLGHAPLPPGAAVRGRRRGADHGLHGQATAPGRSARRSAHAGASRQGAPGATGPQAAERRLLRVDHRQRRLRVRRPGAQAARFGGRLQDRRGCGGRRHAGGAALVTMLVLHPVSDGGAARGQRARRRGRCPSSAPPGAPADPPAVKATASAAPPTGAPALSAATFAAPTASAAAAPPVSASAPARAAAPPGPGRKAAAAPPADTGEEEHSSCATDHRGGARSQSPWRAFLFTP